MGDMQPTRISLDEFTKLRHQRYKSRCKSKAQNPVMTMIMELNIGDAIIIDHGTYGCYRSGDHYKCGVQNLIYRINKERTEQTHFLTSCHVDSTEHQIAVAKVERR